MRRHDLDLVSLLTGLGFLAVAVAHLVGSTTNLRLDPDWVLPVVLLGTGAAGLLVALSRLGREVGRRGSPPRR